MRSKNNKVKYSIVTKIVFAFTTIILIIILFSLLQYPKLIVKDKEINIELGQEFLYKDYKAKVLGLDITKEVEVEGIPENKVGTYEVTYTIHHSIFKASKKLIVHVIDKTSPTITLKGKKEINLCKIEDYQEEGYEATDNYDGDITNKVTITKNNDYIHYHVKDSYGNETSVGRKINLEDKESPKISLSGNKTIYLTLNSTFTEPGYTASDNCLGDITDKVEVTNTIDTTKTGTYYVKYKVSDNKNTTEVQRTIYVVEEGANKGVIYLTFDDGPGNYTNKILDTLKKYNIKATFFVTNNGSDETILREYQEGHTVGLHTATHRWSIYNSVEDYFNDLNAVQERVSRITGQKAKYIRFPGGSSNTVSRSHSKGIMTTLAAKVQEEGYRYFDWNSLVEDAGACAAKKVKDKNSCVLKYFKNTISYNKVNVVLLHDIKSYTANSLENMILYAKSLGYEFRPIDEATPQIHQHINN